MKDNMTVEDIELLGLVCTSFPEVVKDGWSLVGLSESGYEVKGELCDSFTDSFREVWKLKDGGELTEYRSCMVIPTNFNPVQSFDDALKLMTYMRSLSYRFSISLGYGDDNTVKIDGIEKKGSVEELPRLISEVALSAWKTKVEGQVRVYNRANYKVYSHREG